MRYAFQQTLLGYRHNFLITRIRDGLFHPEIQWNHSPTFPPDPVQCQVDDDPPDPSVQGAV